MFPKFFLELIGKFYGIDRQPGYTYSDAHVVFVEVFNTFFNWKTADFFLSEDKNPIFNSSLIYYVISKARTK